jgi:hypothetical protein
LIFTLFLLITKYLIFKGTLKMIKMERFPRLATFITKNLLATAFHLIATHWSFNIFLAKWTLFCVIVNPFQIDTTHFYLFHPLLILITSSGLMNFRLAFKAKFEFAVLTLNVFGNKIPCYSNTIIAIQSKAPTQIFILLNIFFANLCFIFLK